MDSIGDRIKALREALRCTQKELANRLEMSFSMLQKYEYNNSKPGSDFLERLSRIAGVNIDWLLTGTGPMFNENVEFEKHTNIPLVREPSGIYRTPSGGMQAGLDPVTPYSPEELLVAEMLHRRGFEEDDFTDGQISVLQALVRSEFRSIMDVIDKHIREFHKENTAADASRDRK